MRFKQIMFVGGFLALLAVIGFSPAMSQSETIITIAVPEWQRDTFGDSLFEDFEAAHPGVKVVPVFTQPSGFFIGAGADEEQMQSSFDSIFESVALADVLQANNYSLNIEATRAGAYLDLSPLISNDPDFNVSDFHTAVWNSYQWDRGIWAIPTSYNAQLLVYDAKKFDDAGLSYPDESWTLTDFANAAREFAQTDEEGNVTIPGLTGYDTKYLAISLTGSGFLDQNVIPNEPLLNTPELQAFIDEWTLLLDEGVVQSFGDYDNTEVAMALDYSWRLQNFGPSDPDHEWRGTLLPGGTAGLDVTGYAVSAGTANPELAYELIKFMSLSAEVNAQNFGQFPARKSLVGVEAENQQFAPPPLPEEVAALMTEAGENGIPVADIQFGNYLQSYLVRFPGQFDDDNAEDQDELALEDIQNDVLEILAFAETQRDSQVVLVATPVPTPVIQQGQIVLNFQLGVPFSPLPNRETWDEFIAEFVANEPTVGNIDLVTGFGIPGGGGGGDDATPMDCYYTSDNQVQNMDLSTVISLDPFMDADPDFDDSDFLGTTLQQVQRDNATWAYPVALQPSILSYDSSMFEQAGVAAPSPDWTIDEFVDTMQQLMDSDVEFDYAFDGNDFGGNSLYLLMAAYGGVPIDYSTNPTTINLTDPTTVAAIQQVLDLAKDGYIRYQQLDNPTGGGGGGFSSMIPIRGTNANSLTWELSYRMSDDAPSGEFVNPTRYMVYPTGTNYTPLGYSIGTGYISASSQSPEACYKLLKEIAARPELLLGMPARRSHIENGDLVTLLGENVTELYVAYAEKLASPDAVNVPSPFTSFSGFSSYIEITWVNQAFDNYVLNDANLEEELTEAQRKVDEYRACAGVEGPPPDFANMTQEEIIGYYQQFIDCASQVDPALAERFNFSASGEGSEDE